MRILNLFPFIALSILTLNSCNFSYKHTPITPARQSNDRGTSQERMMIAIVRGHPRQKRKELIYDARLASAARTHARHMGKHNLFSHQNVQGVSANFRVAATGYKLPTPYLAFKSSNQIESLVAGSATAAEAFAQWMESKHHRSHILALAPFYQGQTLYGIGYAHVPNSTYKHYWVFLSAPPERK